MGGYYSELLAKIEPAKPKNLRFEVSVLRRYREIEGPWRLHRDDITFYSWLDEEPVKLIVLGFKQGKDEVLVSLRDLASLPKSEQEHWKKFEITY
jgi:hypothetical protein